jgi:hypothetical protein
MIQRSGVPKGKGLQLRRKLIRPRHHCTVHEDREYWQLGNQSLLDLHPHEIARPIEPRFCPRPTGRPLWTNDDHHRTRLSNGFSDSRAEVAAERHIIDVLEQSCRAEG